MSSHKPQEPRNSHQKKRPTTPSTPWKSITRFLGSFGMSIIIFVLIITAYSLITETKNDTINISLSELSNDISSGLVSKLSVDGDVLTATYKDDVVKVSKKESDTALTTTLTNYGVPSEKIASVQIDIAEPSGLAFWVQNLLPFIIPIIFIGILIWFLTRQMKGAGAQAMSFGQSKARVIFPDDKKQKLHSKMLQAQKEAKTRTF